MKDALQRFIFEKAPVRGEYIQLHESFQTIVKQHNYPEPIRKLLGEALCAAGLLSAIIKFNGRLTVQFRGKGQLKLLLAQCDNQLNMRGLVKWDGEMTYDTLMQSFQEGVLVIMLDDGSAKNRYQGIVSWQGNSLAESIQGYFKESEQLATKIWLSANEHVAAGLLLQVIPGGDKSPAAIESEIIKPHWDYISGLAAKLNSEQLLRSEYQELLTSLYPDEEIRIFPEVNVAFNCTCSRKRSEDAIRLLGREEAEAEIKNKNSLVVTCDFCNKEYAFDKVDVAQIFEDNMNPPTNIYLH